MAKWMAEVIQQEERTREVERNERATRAKTTVQEGIAGSGSDGGKRQTGPGAESLFLGEVNAGANGREGMTNADCLSDIVLPPDERVDSSRPDRDNGGPPQHTQTCTHTAIPTNLQDDDDDLYYEKHVSKRQIDSPPPSRPRSPLPPPPKKARTSPNRPSTVAPHLESSPRSTRGGATSSLLRKSPPRPKPKPRKATVKPPTPVQDATPKTRRTGLRSSGPAAPV